MKKNKVISSKEKRFMPVGKIMKIMKVLTFVMFVCIVHVSARSYSQITKLSMNMQNVSIKQVLSKIEDQSEFRFLYSDSKINVEKIVDVDFNNKPIEDILRNVFEGSNILFKVVGKQILLSNSTESAENTQQQKSISGKVTDSSGSPLPGVTVAVKGTTNGTITNTNGNYSLSNLPANATLQFSFIGMKSQEIVAGNKTTINMMLSEETIGIEEVVAVGYGTQKKINLTGAVSSVDSKVLESRPITNLGQGLQGITPNLNITQYNGAPGQGASFNIRGNTSINGGSPLILVNGIPIDPNLLNPNDIASVTVLKDAASAAIYGARAAYGVILITTKGGKKNDKPVVSLSMNYSMNSPVVKFETMDAVERMNYMNEGSIRATGRPWEQFDKYYAEKIIAHYNDPSQPETFQHPNESPNEYAFSANINWPRELLRSSFPMQQYTSSVSGGSDKFDYYTSFSYFNQKGMARHFDENYDRYNFMTNLNYNITKWFTVGTKISVNNSKKRYPINTGIGEQAIGFYKYQWANWPIYLPDGHFATLGSVPNQVQQQEEGGYNAYNISDSWLTGLVKLTPVKNMTFNMDYSSNVYNRNDVSYKRLLPMYNRLGLAGYYPFTNPSSVTRANTNNSYYVFNAYADYENTFSKKHYVKAMAGFNQENTSNSQFWAMRQKLIVETIPYMNLATGDRFVGDGGSETAVRGAFARLNYSYADRYLVEFNGRYDGTSKFSKKDRFAFFPSGSLAWRVDNEAFFTGLKNSISMLKLRGSYGSLGNQNVSGNYPYIATSGAVAANYLINGDRPMTVLAPGLVSATLTWETVTQRNLGVDFALLDGRLTGTFDIYRRDTKNMLTRSQTLPAVLAVNEPQANAADMKTSGFDLTLDWKHNIRDFRYGITFLLSDYTSEITKFSNPSGNIYDYYVGQKLGDIWGLVTGGFFNTDAEAAALDQTQITGRVRQAGDIWFKDLDGDGKITRGQQTLTNHGDMKIIGNNTPRYSFGFKTNASWKGFDLDLFLQGVAKRDIELDNQYFTRQYIDEWSAQTKIGVDYWTPANPNAYFPRPLINGGYDVTTTQTHFLQNAAYLRLKQLTFGYTIPEKLTQKLKIERMRVYFSGNNLWEATKMIKISDPEQVSVYFYPLNRSISVGMNISF
ncbi:MAG: TonB-dependent receptor [Prolixibacteraceae bacterium]|jgi:TonB-linked SusC/RagA family outer membrane protein|nr:TonB-dependent receptor [Prolixibacteraceae bacterium]